MTSLPGRHSSFPDAAERPDDDREKDRLWSHAGGVVEVEGRAGRDEGEVEANLDHESGASRDVAEKEKLTSVIGRGEQINLHNEVAQNRQVNWLKMRVGSV